MWKLGAVKEPGCIYKEEFLKGMEELGAYNIETLTPLLPTFDIGFLETKEFKKFYNYCFQFSREGTIKTLGNLLN